MKKCTKCLVMQPLTSFPPNKRCLDGLQPSCRVCCNAAVAACRAKDPNRYKARYGASAAIYRAANQMKKKAYDIVYRAANKVNPEMRRIRSQNRRARKLEAGGKLSPGLAAKLFKLQKGKCPCCKQSLGTDYHLDHRMPLFLGGSNTDDNMQLLRSTCNIQKGTKHPVAFMQSRGFLL